jgi:hypothetical protein
MPPMPPDPSISAWTPAFASAITGVLTGGALLLQTRMSNERDAKRLAAEAKEREIDRLRADKGHEAGQLLKARSQWMAAYQTYYGKVRHGLAMAREQIIGEIALANANRARDAGELLLKRTSTLQLVEKDPLNRRLIHWLTLVIMVDHDRKDPKEMHRIEDIFLAFIAFGDVLAGIDGDVEALVKRLALAEGGPPHSVAKFREYILKGRPPDALTPGTG